MQVLVKSYAFLLQKGTYPSSWRENVIKPIYYKGGGSHDPSNYRRVAISSCFSKLFNKICLDKYKE